ncbi:MAG: ribonuclease P protein component [Verrucomicrobia bacterium]|nr:ribonuclease P protein component [Verrucomicrobiota bacterium]
MAVPAHQRLRSQSDFQQVRSRGTRIHCGLFIVQYLQHAVAEPPAPRLGVIASRRVGNAVKRNYGKRLVRNLFRQHQAMLPKGLDLVVVLRSDFDSVPFAELDARFSTTCQKISAA